MSYEKTANQIVEDAFMSRLEELEAGDAKLAHLATTSAPFNKLAKAYGLIDETVAVDRAKVASTSAATSQAAASSTKIAERLRAAIRV